MSERLKFERYVWLHHQIKLAKYPNSQSLVHQFEVSQRTALRDIEFMRETLQAPLEFDRSRNGYRYADNTYEIPGHWINEGNVLALALAVRLASTIPDAAIKEELCSLIGQMTNASRKNGASCLDGISDKVSVKNIEYAKVNEQHFRRVVQALFADHALRITYHSPHSGAVTERTVQPLHLMHYMGSWHLLAWCASKSAIRDFALARLQAVALADKPLHLPDTLPPIKAYTRRHFGIMQGGTTTMATLRFSPHIAPRILEQIWHPDQQTSLEPDGSLLLSFPTADFRELVRNILSYGAEVRVVEPAELRELVRGEIEKMFRNICSPDIE